MCFLPGVRGWLVARRARRVVRLALLLVLIVLSPCPVFSQARIQQILATGPSDKRINIVFLSEGYSSVELPQFVADARFSQPVHRINASISFFCRKATALSSCRSLWPMLRM
jgi:hypothetical protein